MSLRRTAPTAAQLTFASSLGIDVPEGASKSELSELIDHAKVRSSQQRVSTEHLAMEVAARVTHPTGSPRRLQMFTQMSALIRASGIKAGSTIRCSQGRLWRVTSINAEKAMLTAIQGPPKKLQLSPVNRVTMTLNVTLVPDTECPDDADAQAA